MEGFRRQLSHLACGAMWIQNIVVIDSQHEMFDYLIVGGGTAEYIIRETSNVYHP